MKQSTLDQFLSLQYKVWTYSTRQEREEYLLHINMSFMHDPELQGQHCCDIQDVLYHLAQTCNKESEQQPMEESIPLLEALLEERRAARPLMPLQVWGDTVYSYLERMDPILKVLIVILCLIMVACINTYYINLRSN